MTRLAMSDGVHYEVGVEGSGPPLLLLHGFTGSRATWAATLPTLRREHRTIVVDLLGHGDSDAPVAARHAVEWQAADLAAILDRLDAVPADVLGYSFGARVALRLAIDAPSAIRRLVVESPSAGIADAAARELRRAADMRWVAQLERGDLDAFATDWAAQSIFASQARLPPEAQARLAAQRREQQPRGLSASLQGAGQGVMDPMHAALGRIGVPALVISGPLDPLGTQRAAEVAAAIPGAIHETVRDVGHAPHLEAPALFWALVDDFLSTPVAAITSSPTA